MMLTHNSPADKGDMNHMNTALTTCCLPWLVALHKGIQRIRDEDFTHFRILVVEPTPIEKYESKWASSPI